MLQNEDINFLVADFPIHDCLKMLLVLVEVHLHLNLVLFVFDVPCDHSSIIFLHLLFLLWLCGLGKPWSYAFVYHL